MRKNIYTETVKEIKISESAITDALEIVRETESKKRLRFSLQKVRVVGIVMASILMVTALGGIFTNMSISDKLTNSFVISVNAEQMNSLNYLRIGELKSDGGSQKASYNIDDDGNERFFYLNIQKAVDFPVICSGDNIDNINFRINGKGYFILPTDAMGIINKEPVETTEEFNRSLDYYPFSAERDGYSDKVHSYTVSPNTQTHDMPVLMLYVEDDNGKYCETVNNSIYYNEELKSTILDINDAKIFKEIFNQNIKDYSVDVTVTYKDSETETKRIIFETEEIDRTEQEEDGTEIHWKQTEIKAKIEE